MVCGMHLSHQPNGMPPSHEQKRISELCSRVITTNDPAEFAQVVAELRVALRAQLARLKQLVYETKQTIAQLPPAPWLERRKMERRRMERRH
jgi:hypothetical protein